MNTKFFQYILFAFVVGAGIIIASCSKDEDTVSTDPVVLSYGPSPALRGAGCFRCRQSGESYHQIYD